MQDLLVHRLVALAVGFGAHQQQGRAGGLEPHLGIFRHRPGRLFDRVDQRDATQLACRARGIAARGEPGEIAGVHRHVHVLREGAAVIDLTQSGLVRHLLRLDHVAFAQFDAVDAEFLGGGLDDPLHQVDRLGPARAAVRRRRVGVGQHGVDRNESGGDVVDAGQRDDHPERRQQLPVGGDIGADAGQHVQSHAEEFVILVERQFRSRRHCRGRVRRP